MRNNIKALLLSSVAGFCVIAGAVYAQTAPEQEQVGEVKGVGAIISDVGASVKENVREGVQSVGNAASAGVEAVKEKVVDPAANKIREVTSSEPAPTADEMAIRQVPFKEGSPLAPPNNDKARVGAEKAAADTTVNAEPAEQNDTQTTETSDKKTPAKDKAKPGDDAPTVILPTLNDDGTIARTAKIGSDMLILQQEQKRIEQMKTIIDQVGIENAVIMYPDLANHLTTSPIALQAQLTRVQLLNQLREEVAKTTAPTEFERKLAAEEAQKLASAETGADMPKIAEGDMMSMPINDGQMVLADPDEAPVTRADIASIIEEMRQQEQQDALINEQIETQKAKDALTLSEVYGANGEMVAVITDGGSIFKLKVGDNMPNGDVVTNITNDKVTINRDGEEVLLRFH